MNTTMKLPPKVKDLKGNVYGRLTVLEFIGVSRNGARWSCHCSCGNSAEVNAADLKSGNTVSCGCRRANYLGQKSITHGESSGSKCSPTYAAWRSMINRCHTVSSSSYKDYGAKGIYVCTEWRHDYLRFKKDMGEKPDGYSLERINVREGYSADNCKWIPIKDQVKNKRNTVRVLLNGNPMIQSEAARELGLHPYRLTQWRKGANKIPPDLDLVFLDNIQTITR